MPVREELVAEGIKLREKPVGEIGGGRDFVAGRWQPIREGTLDSRSIEGSSFGAPMVSRASATNAAVSALLFSRYCEKPPSLTSASTAQIPENTLCREY